MDITPQYQPYFVFLTQLLRNICLFNHNHWANIFRKRDNVTMFQFWVDFMERQFKHGLFLDFDGGYPFISGMVMIMIVAVKNMKSDWCRNWKQDFGIKQMKKWLNKLKTMYDVQPKVNMAQVQMMMITNIGDYKMLDGHKKFMLIKTLLLLLDDETADELYDMIWESGEEVLKLKWNDMRCGYRECHVRRRENGGKLYKCKKCRVIRYCSKHCQKLDWNQNDHKKCCKKFNKMRKQRHSWQKLLREKFD